MIIWVLKIKNEKDDEEIIKISLQAKMENNQNASKVFWRLHVTLRILNFIYLSIFWLFHATDLFLHPLKNRGVSDIVRNYRKRPVVWNGLTLQMTKNF